MASASGLIVSNFNLELYDNSKIVFNETIYIDTNSSLLLLENSSLVSYNTNNNYDDGNVNNDDDDDDDGNNIGITIKCTEMNIRGMKILS